MVKRSAPLSEPTIDGIEFQKTSLLLESVVRRINAATTAILKEQNLTLEQWRILDQLIQTPEMPMTELAAAVLTPAPSLTRAVDRLVAGALVYRSSAMNDRRRVLVQPSQRGEEMHARLAQRVAEIHNSAFEALDREERAEFLAFACRLQVPA